MAKKKKGRFFFLLTAARGKKERKIALNPGLRPVLRLPGVDVVRRSLPRPTQSSFFRFLLLFSFFFLPKPTPTFVFIFSLVSPSHVPLSRSFFP